MNKKNVLIVSSEVSERILSVCNMLKAMENEVAWALNGLRALEILSESHVDCVVIDLDMPNLEGYGLRETLSRVPGLEKLRISFLKDGDAVAATPETEITSREAMQTELQRLSCPVVQCIVGVASVQAFVKLAAAVI